jgi:phage gp36-like protein
MPYATFEQLTEAYGWTEISQLLEDEEGLVTEALLKDVFFEADLGGYSAEEIAAATVALLRATNALLKQSHYIDSKLAAKYSLPLPAGAEDTTPLKECCLALTRPALADDGDNISTTMKEERKHWREWLNDIANGNAFLPGIAHTAEGGNVNRRITSKPCSSVDLDRYNNINRYSV